MDERTAQSLLSDMGISASDTQVWELLFHLDAVLQANTQVNLTSITDRDEAILLHVLDSLTCLDAVDAAAEGALADLGSGAGYPGIPLAIMRERSVTLIEARSKKAMFLRTVVTALDHEIEVYGRRAEELAQEKRGSFSVIVARAVAPLPTLVEIASPLLRKGGSFVALKGDPSAEEIARGDTAAARVGLEEGVISRLRIPTLDVKRSIVTYIKGRESEVPLPRRPGMAQKKPLA